MKKQRINNVRRSISMLAILAGTFMLGNQALAGRHMVLNLDESFVDTESFCVPVLAHAQGKLILGTDFPTPTVVQSIATTWTNLETGKSVTTRTVGRSITRFESEAMVTITGAVMIQQRDNTWVDAGLVQFIVQIDPNTGREINVVVRDTGNQPGNFADALCAALQ